MPTPQNSTTFKIISLAVTITYPVLLGISSWAVFEIVDHDKRIEVMESTRYTKENAADDKAMHTAQIAELSRVQSTTDVYLNEILRRLDRMERYMERDFDPGAAD